MRMNKITLIIGGVSLTAAVAVAGLNLLTTVLAGTTSEVQAAESERTATFVVEKLTCAMCPITVRKAAQKVAGVNTISVDIDAGTATVVFDPAITTPAEIGAAITNAGYPAVPASLSPPRGAAE